jgi:NAD(P)H-dependent FMN reductase
MPTLAVIICSTRPGRIGAPIANWFASVAATKGGFDVDLVDLKTVDLPLFDEPNHPMLADYVHDHTKRWSAIVSRADAVVFVTPEYNHSFNAATKNAIDFLHNEWQHKPVGFVSYGGVSGGTRAVQALKPICAALRMVPAVSAVILPFPFAHVDDDGTFNGDEAMAGAASGMLDELARWTETLRPLRA